MSYLVPFFLFVLVVAGGLAVIRFVSVRTAEPDGEKRTPIAADDHSPLWATDEASDAGVDRRARRREEQRISGA
jgi:hypothetical protein